MIKLTALATVYSVTPVVQISENFSKRELILDDSWTRDGMTKASYVSIEFTGEKMALLDTLNVGDQVMVEAYVSGREYNGRYYNSIRGASVTLAPSQQQGQMGQTQQPQQMQQSQMYQPSASQTQQAQQPHMPQSQGFQPPFAFAQQMPNQQSQVGNQNIPF